MKERDQNSEGIDTSNVKTKKYLSKFLKDIESQQNNGPFTIRDSGLIEELHKKLEDNAVNYDNEPVTACPFCNSLYLLDIDNKLECFKCGNEVAEKDVVVYKSIVTYLDGNV